MEENDQMESVFMHLSSSIRGELPSSNRDDGEAVISQGLMSSVVLLASFLEDPDNVERADYFYDRLFRRDGEATVTKELVINALNLYFEGSGKDEKCSHYGIEKTKATRNEQAIATVRKSLKRLEAREP